VRTSDNVELMLLDKKSFLDLDRSTLNIIAENARYNAACTKEPGQRTRDDLQILQQRTAHLSHLAALSTDVHIELCRVMRYRKVNEGTMLVRKGLPASCLYVLISGSASTYSGEPRRRWSLASGALKDAGKRAGRRSVSVDAFQGMKATDTLHSGQAIGEDELLQEDPVYTVTAITSEPVELMEIDRKDFDRILKADRTSEKGRLIEFLQSLSVFDGISVAAVHAISNSLTRKSFMRNQLCLSHPPDPTLGSASFSNDFIYLIFSGEARLICGADPKDKRAAPTIDAGHAPFGPHVDTAHPGNSKVERHLDLASVPVATLGPGECISENMLPHMTSRWCLKPITALELLIVPRKDWSDIVRSSSLADLKTLAEVKAIFFQQHLDHTVQQTAAMHMVGKHPHPQKAVQPISPRKGAISSPHGIPPPLPAPPRNAYEPIGSPRSPSPRLPPLDDTAGSFDAADGGSPRKKGDGMPPIPGSPKIRLSKGSNVPTIRAHG